MGTWPKGEFVSWLGDESERWPRGGSVICPTDGFISWLGDGKSKMAERWISFLAGR
jgi:hypothetical protein